jgi:hypothetical protein
MDLSRRRFLACAGGALGAQWRLRTPLRLSTLNQQSLVLPVRGQCALPESILGYRSALADVNEPLLVIPAIMELPYELGVLISHRLQNGWTVLIESGGGFADAANFGKHRRSLCEILEIEVGAPVNLWAPDRKPRFPPYVDFAWPCSAKIRDFSRAVPVTDQPDEIIAWAGERPVALRRCAGRGSLVFLGSPIGPALWAGDAEARRWLLALTMVS